MFEGLAQLKWTAQDAEARAHLWRGYIFIEEWRQMMEAERNGVSTDDVNKEAINDFIADHGGEYLSRKTEKRDENGQSRKADPYRRWWYNSDIASIFEQVQAKVVYDRIYRESSNLVHWNVSAIGHALHFDSNVSHYNENDARSAATALNAGFQALFECLSVLNAHHNLGLNDQLDNIIEAKLSSWNAKYPPSS